MFTYITNFDLAQYVGMYVSMSFWSKTCNPFFGHFLASDDLKFSTQRMKAVLNPITYVMSFCIQYGERLNMAVYLFLCNPLDMDIK